jgi:hypothetical protein
LNCVSEEEVTVLRQTNPTDERAPTDKDPVMPEDRVPVHDEPTFDEPTFGSVSGDEGQHVDVEPLSVDDATWGRPVTPAPTPVGAGPVQMRRRLSWGQVLIVLAGAAALVFGIGAVILGGLAGSVTAPVVQVFTYDHTPLLGLIETGAGVVLIVCGFIPGGRWIAGPVGVAAIVGGALVIAELDWIQENLAAEQRFGWVAIAIGSVAYFGAMVPTKKRVDATYGEH